jgi:hypothetical protein
LVRNASRRFKDYRTITEHRTPTVVAKGETNTGKVIVLISPSWLRGLGRRIALGVIAALTLAGTGTASLATPASAAVPSSDPAAVQVYHFGRTSFSNFVWLRGGANFSNPQTLDVEMINGGAYAVEVWDTDSRVCRIQRSNPTGGWASFSFISGECGRIPSGSYRVRLVNAASGTRSVLQGDLRYGTASAQVAAPLATCLGPTCTGKDPNATGCASDARTVRSTSVDGIAVELRYSPTCRAAWSRIRNGGSGDIARVENNIGQSYSRSITGGNDVYTPMVNDMNVTARACGTNVQPFPLPNHTACTGYF